MVAEENQGAVQSKFVTRVSTLPTVEAALGLAVSSYKMIKEASPAPLKAVIEVGEKTTNMALATSQPIISKFQGPISYVDSIACQGLDRVEQTVPAVKETPEKIMSDVKQYGTTKVSSMRDSVVEYSSLKLQQFGLGSVTPERIGEYREQLVGYAALALAAAEGALDSHLVSSGAEIPVEIAGSDKNGGLRTRIEQCTAKARLCVAHHTTSQFVAAQKYASDGVGRVLEALQVIRSLKDNVQKGISIQEITQEHKFEWLLKLLEESKDKSASQQALYIAQAAAHEAHEALNKASGEVKTKFGASYSAVLTRANELTVTLQNTSAAQLSVSVLSTIQEQALHLQTLIQQVTGLNLAQYLPEMRQPQQVPSIQQEAQSTDDDKKQQ